MSRSMLSARHTSFVASDGGIEEFRRRRQLLASVVVWHYDCEAITPGFKSQLLYVFLYERRTF